jgi:hypothetical protein
MEREPIQLTVTLLEDKLDEVAAGRASYNLKEIVSGFPEMSILSGDPRYSLEIAIPARFAVALRKRVAGVCSVSVSSPLKLQHY